MVAVLAIVSINLKLRNAFHKCRRQWHCLNRLLLPHRPFTPPSKIIYRPFFAQEIEPRCNQHDWHPRQQCHEKSASRPKRPPYPRTRGFHQWLMQKIQTIGHHPNPRQPPPRKHPMNHRAFIRPPTHQRRKSKRPKHVRHRIRHPTLICHRKRPHKCPNRRNCERPSPLRQRRRRFTTPRHKNRRPHSTRKIQPPPKHRFR